MEEKRFPQYLSAPYQVLWFESDDIGITTLLFILAMMFGGWFWLIMIVGPIVYMKVKFKYTRGFLKHLLYFTGMFTMNGYPSFFEKEFTE